MVKISSLNKYYNKNKRNELHVLKNIDIELPQCGMVAIFGKSGCGKTTLLNIIGGLDNSNKGKVYIDNNLISSNANYVRNKYIGYVFQNYYLNNDETCFENVADALKLCGIRDKEEIHNRVIAALKNVGMEKYTKRTPDTLSGGQMQRIAIARAIVKNPHVLLADEPTGNLDEENTIMIMDLLKEISRDRLVVLVTHEEKLVDYYCDKVIEIKDGEITNTYNNTNVNGYNGKPKNYIYLGDFGKKEISEGNMNIEFYGDLSEKTLDIKIVSHEGLFYLKINDDAKVQILDASSEIKLVEGVFEDQKTTKKERKKIDMSLLPPIEGKRYGKLFNFREGFISGFKNNFAKKKKKKLLYWCMSAFALSIVFSCSFFGMALKEYTEINSKISDNVFYIQAANKEISEKINSSIGTNGILQAYLSFNYPVDGDIFEVPKINFESSKNNGIFYNEDPYYNVKALGIDIIPQDVEFYGKIQNLKDNEIVITTTVADKIINDFAVGYISEYKDVLNLNDKNGNIIVGIIKSNKMEVYYTNLALAKMNMNNRYFPVYTDEDIGLGLNTNEVILYTFDNPYGYKKDNLFKINGIDFRIKYVISDLTYEDWCDKTGKTIPLNKYEYFIDMIKRDYPDLSESDILSGYYVDSYRKKYYYTYLDEYYIYIDEYLNDMYRIGNGYIPWLYCEKNIEHAKFLYIGYDEYYTANLYKEEHGKYPPRSIYEVDSSKIVSIQTLENTLFSYQLEYEKLSTQKAEPFVVIDTEAFINVANRIGDTSIFDSLNFDDDNLQNDFTENFWLYDYYMYYKIVSSDTIQTEAFINDILSEVIFDNNNNSYHFMESERVYTPNDIYNILSAEYTSFIVVSFISMVVYLLLVSVCIFFVMKASTMHRIKEIGIFRAVGMSRRNVLLKFLAESTALTTISVLPGFIIASALIKLWTNQSVLIKDVFYLTPVMEIVLFVFIYFICIVAGIIPIAFLLRKTPSEILSKYDI